MLVLVEGTLLAHGRRTVTAALRTMGLSENVHFNIFHHTLSRAHWSAFRLSHLLLLLLVQTFVPSNAVVEMVVDETLERRWGPHIRKCAYYEVVPLSWSRRTWKFTLSAVVHKPLD